MTDQHHPVPTQPGLAPSPHSLHPQSLRPQSLHPQSLRTRDAIAALQLSRQRLAQRLLPAPAERADSGTNPGASDNWFSQAAEGLKRWFEGSPAAPLWQSAQAFGQHWWQRQAWRPGAQAAGGALRSRVAPWVQQHPVLSLGLVAGLSAALVWGRPWSHPWVRTQATQARGRVWRWVVREASVVPLHLLVPALLAAWSAQTAKSAAAQAAAATAPAAGAPAAAQGGAADAAPRDDSVAAGSERDPASPPAPAFARS